MATRFCLDVFLPFSMLLILVINASPSDVPRLSTIQHLHKSQLEMRTSCETNFNLCKEISAITKSNPSICTKSFQACIESIPSLRVTETAELVEVDLHLRTVHFAKRQAAAPLNLMPYAGALIGISPPTVTEQGGKLVLTAFGKNVTDFPLTDLPKALVRACDEQKKACDDASDYADAGRVTKEQCTQQLTACKAAVAQAPDPRAKAPGAGTPLAGTPEAGAPASSKPVDVSAKPASGNPVTQAPGTPLDLMTYKGALIGITPPTVTEKDGKLVLTAFGKNITDFPIADLAKALIRACDEQKKACDDASDYADAGRVTKDQCAKQNEECKAAVAQAPGASAKKPVDVAAKPSTLGDSIKQQAPGDLVDLMPFKGALIGIAAPTITQKDGKLVLTAFGKNITDFPIADLAKALVRACDEQKKFCDDAADYADAGRVTKEQCAKQNAECKSFVGQAPAILPPPATGVPTSGSPPSISVPSPEPGSYGGSLIAAAGQSVTTPPSTLPPVTPVDLMPYKGALIGIAPPTVIQKDGKLVLIAFGKNITDFPLTDLPKALVRACDEQKKFCDNAADYADAGRVTKEQCAKQNAECKSFVGQAQGTQPVTGTPPSATPNAEFSSGPSFCNQAGLGGALADGTQKLTATCSTTILGAIPAADKMVSTFISAPAFGATVKRDQPLTVDVRVSNMELGIAVDNTKQYYAIPQTLNAQGIVEGHIHLAVQYIVDAITPPNPQDANLVFFIALNGRDVNGLLSTTIPPNTFPQPGVLRICTVAGTRSHSPPVMPQAKRGPQDDCIRILAT